MKKPRNNKYLQLLETDLALERARNEKLEKNLDFFQGKCERLELAMASNPAAQQSYAAETTSVRKPPPLLGGQVQLPGRMPFAELKRRWTQKTEAEQNEIIEKGEWDVTKEANNNAGQ